MTNSYGAEQIQVLEGLDPVRKRPGMYIGSTGPRGLHHLVYEVVDNSIDEALAGYCTHIEVDINADGSVRVTDDGRGIPTDTHPTTGKSALETVMTVLHAGGKFGGGGYKVSGGLHGVGVSVVNALSEWVEVTVWREQKVHNQRYEKGVPIGDLAVKPEANHATGTSVHFLPDIEIFSTGIEFDYTTLAGRLKELGYLNAGVKITFTDYRPEEPRVETYCYEGGIKEYVAYMTREKQPLHQDIIYANQERDGVQVEVALQWCIDAFSDNLLGFANNIRTIDGGTHLEGLKTVLTRTMNTVARKRNKIKENESNLGGENVREGLTGVISVKVPEPEFEGQTKTKLGNTEVRGIVDSLVGEVLNEYLEFNPQVADSIIEKAVQAFKAAEAARRARELVRRKSVLESSPLPGKLADCSTRDPEESEIFLVEGDSAGGCFHGDTLVALADGRCLSFKQLVAEDKQGKANFCYTIRQDGSVGIERIVAPRITKVKAKVIEVILENQETIICTLDHQFMLRNGSYKPAAWLTSDDLLMSFRLFAEVGNSEEELIATGSEKQFFKSYIDDYQTVGTSQSNSQSVSVALAEKLSTPVTVNENHRVIAIKYLEDQYDVYDIEVPHTHNFALARGVFVHNSAKQGRDRRFQAILPLRGKILNIEKTDDAKIYKNNEIQSLITALGLGIKGEEFDPEQLRYHRIVIMSVAGDEPTLVADDTGKTELVEIGKFIDDCIEGRRTTERYRVISFDPVTNATRFRPLKAVIRHGHEEAMYKITTRYNRSIKVTSSHSVYVYEKGEVTLKKGNEIKAGDLLVASRRLPRPTETPSKIDLLKTFYQAGLTQSLYLQGEDVTKVAAKRVVAKLGKMELLSQPRVKLATEAWQKLISQRQTAGVTQQQVATVCGVKQPITISHWERGINQPTLPDFLSYLDAIGGNEDVIYETLPSKLEEWANQDDSSKNAGGCEVSNYKDFEYFTPSELAQLGDNIKIVPQAHIEKAFPRYLPITKELIWFLGWYVAEGSLSNHQVSLNLGKKDEVFVPELISCIEKVFGETPRCDENSNSKGIKLDFHSVAAARLLTAWNVANLANEKRLPDLIFSLGEELQLTFLESYFLGDGTTVGKNISFTTNSPQLKDGLLYLFGQLGLIATTTEHQEIKEEGREKREREDNYNCYQIKQEGRVEREEEGNCYQIKQEARGNKKEGRRNEEEEENCYGYFDSCLLEEQELESTDSLLKNSIKTQHNYYTITIDSQQQLEKCRQIWQRHNNAKKIDTYLSKLTRQNQNFVPISDDLIGLPVITNQEIELVGDYVYDFSVEGDENFICGTGGLAAHNTDADVDGAHIRTLLLTFFYRYQRDLVDQGYIYIACPPLYKLERGRNHYYCYSDRELQQQIAKFPENANYTIQRFKGLGEMMPKQLWDTTMNPETRTLKRVEIEDAAEADRIFTVLMGDRVAPRREFIETYGPRLNLTDLDI